LEQESLLERVAHDQHRAFAPPFENNVRDLGAQPGVADTIDDKKGYQERNPDRTRAEQLHEEQQRKKVEGPSVTQFDAP